MNEWKNYVTSLNDQTCTRQQSDNVQDNILVNTEDTIQKEQTYIYNSVILQNEKELISKNITEQNDPDSVRAWNPTPFGPGQARVSQEQIHECLQKSDDLSYQIATITMSSKITNCELNLVNIGKYLEIDHDIIGIKYSYGNICFSRGIYTTTNYKKSKKKQKTKINQQLFYNQISLVVQCNDPGLSRSDPGPGLSKSEHQNNNDKQINVKLFGNGSLHITGCKSEYDGKYVTELIYNKLKNISYKTHTIILSSNSYGVLLDSNNFIYKQLNDIHINNTIHGIYYNIIGFYDQKTNVYVMNTKEYVVYNKIKNSFISKKNDLQKMKSICNNNGDTIGTFGYCKNKKQNIIKLTDITNMNINENDPGSPWLVQARTESGYRPEQSLDPVSLSCTDTNRGQGPRSEHRRNYDSTNYKIIEYKCNPFLNKNFNPDPVLYRPEQSRDSELGPVSVLYMNVLDNIIKVNIDCINITYQLPYLINRNKLYEYFIDNNYICKYNPQTYSGVKFIYKYPFNNLTSKHGTRLCSGLDVPGTSLSCTDQNTMAGIGICTCNVKCICLNITFLIFRSGNIIVTGFKNIKQINSVLHEFNNIMKKFSDCK